MTGYTLKDAAVLAMVSTVVREIEGQNWTDVPLTDAERDLIGMAVVATLNVLDKKTPGEMVAPK